MTIATILTTILNSGVTLPEPFNKNFEQVLLVFEAIDDNQYTVDSCFSDRIIFIHLPTSNEFMLRKEGVQDGSGKVQEEFVSLYFRAASKDILVLNLVGYGKQANELLNNEFDKLYRKHIFEMVL